ncbi:MAG: AsmA family protein [Kordiimonadaceae bacterium]|nr:AsmA family protein [Kordiimonadaceae bacterium]
MKKPLYIALLLLVIAGLAVFMQLGPIVKTSIETKGPDALHVSVEVGDIQISPLSGKVSITDFNIGQPAGFGDGPMVSLGHFKMQLEPSSLLSNHIIIDSISVIAPRLDVRRKNGKTNFQALHEGIDLPNGAQQTDNADTPVGEEVTLTIRHLSIEAPRLLAKTDGLIKLDEDIQLADFTLTNLGTDEKGLAPREIARHVMDALQPQITKALITAGASKNIQKLAGDAKGKIEKGLGGFLKKLTRKKKKEE